MDGRSELVPGTLELLVLRVLTAGPLHGYAITQIIRELSRERLCVEEGTLYPALHRMERQGLLSASWGRSDANRRAKFYANTTKGRRRLAERRSAWKRVTEAVSFVLDAELGGAGA